MHFGAEIYEKSSRDPPQLEVLCDQKTAKGLENDICLLVLKSNRVIRHSCKASSLLVMKKLGNVFEFVCDEKLWKSLRVCL